MTSRTYLQIWKTVRRIPRGRVATYGQIAREAGMDGQPRLVGYAMHALPHGSSVPWHRVINATGRISLPGPSGRSQREKLETEGIVFGKSGRIPLKTYQWRPNHPPIHPSNQSRMDGCMDEWMNGCHFIKFNTAVTIALMPVFIVGSGAGA